MKIIDHFDVPYYQYLDENSQLAKDIPEFSRDKNKLLDLYRLMTLVRTLDAKAVALQRTGKLGTYPSTRGQEAVLSELAMLCNRVIFLFLIIAT